MTEREKMIAEALELLCRLSDEQIERLFIMVGISK